MNIFICKNKRKAFTLIELLIVIAIIGILFIVLVSKVDFATDKAKVTGVQTDFRSFQMAFDTVAKEHAGFNTFGWDTGDTNGDRVRDSYDAGDTNQDGIKQDGEVWTGHKVYAETWTGVYTLVKPGTDFATVGYDKNVIFALESAINNNLDPKLHVTIGTDGKITMANGAKDPWDTEYHGFYITNATVDNKDRGAIVIYSNGANQEFVSEHSISNGVVSISIPGSNIYGKDDYAIASVYTYVNGYGEVKNITTGFSNNQIMNSHINHSGENIPVVPETPEIPETPETPDVPEIPETPDIPEEPEITTVQAGLYLSGQDFSSESCIKTWSELLDESLIKVNKNNKITSVNRDLEGSLVIEEGIVDIGNAFQYCSKLTGILLPNTLISIGSQPFSSCTQLSFTEYSNAYYIGSYNNPYLVLVKAKSTDITTCSINDTTKLIVSMAFDNCVNLTSINIVDNVYSIGTSAFRNCTSLESVHFGNGLTEIWHNAFESCSSLKEIIIPNNVTNLYSTVFRYCTNLETVVLGDGINIINSYMFYDCTNLKTVTIGKNVKSIDYRAFQQCRSLTTIVLPEGLTTIGGNAFYVCPNLNTVYIPGSVTEIKGESFSNCPGLRHIYYDGTIEQWRAIVSNNSTWDAYSGDYYIVHCTNGDISKE